MLFNPQTTVLRDRLPQLCIRIQLRYRSRESFSVISNHYVIPVCQSKAFRTDRRG